MTYTTTFSVRPSFPRISSVMNPISTYIMNPIMTYDKTYAMTVTFLSSFVLSLLCKKHYHNLHDEPNCDLRHTFTVWPFFARTSSVTNSTMTYTTTSSPP